VPEWQDVDGYVHVNGERVLGNASGKPVRAESAGESMCQRCATGRVSRPLALFKRFEPALGREMFWFGFAPGSRADYCAECAPKMGASKS
jgi:hypothetical protein